MRCLYDIPAPAKLNRFLHVVGRRDDGMHLIQSVFMLIDWCDTLHFELRADGGISREDLTWALPADDLCVRAAKALQQRTGHTQGVHIGIAKSVPAQAGMGGGSSDAASTLLALNRLWGTQLSLQDLMSIGLALGADVPFFLLGQHAWVEGVGEKMQAISLAPAHVLVAKPDAGLDTKAIFQHPDLKRDSQPAIIDGFTQNEKQGLGFVFGENNLQAVAIALCPGVNQALGWLESLGLKARMTGSGSAVFAPALQELDWGVVPDGLQVRLCRSLDVHPLAGWAYNKGLSVGSF